MSQLSDKILSYAVETYWPMRSTPEVSAPEMLGTFLPTATPYMNTSALVPIYDPTANPPGAQTDGSWRFDQPTSGSLNSIHIRTNQATYSNQKVWDGAYGFGLWIRFNSIPTGTTTASYLFFSSARSSSFPGFALNMRGTAHTSGPGVMHNLFSSTTPIIANPVVGQWYYIVGRKSRTSTTASMWVNGVRVALGNNTTGVTTVTSTELPYQINFGSTATPSALNSFSYNISHAHLMDFTTFTDAAIADIYQAGITAPITNNLKYWNGTSWEVPLNKYQWNGSSWIPLNGKYWSGSAWEAIT